MDWIIILFVFFVIPIVAFIWYIFHSFEASNRITILEMHKFERDINQNYRHLFAKKNCFEVAAQLKLQIEENVNMSTIGYKESQLGPTKEAGYNGEILIAKTDVAYLPCFRCYHELVHYLKDVGLGKKVRHVYGKDPRGETRSHREQIINYYAAAIAVPKNELLHDLEDIQDPLDNKGFIKELMDKYKQPESTIIRRIQEVSRLAI